MSRVCLLCLLSSGLIAAGPAPPLDQTVVSVGGVSGGEGRSGVVVLEHSRREIRGLTLSTSASAVLGGADPVGTLALRGGYHGAYGGAELGVGIWLDAIGPASRASVTAWGGHPLLHGWLSTWPGEASGEVLTALSGAGLGHTGERIRASAGVWAGTAADLPLSGRLEMRVNDGIWLGARGWLSPGADARLMVSLSVSRAGLAAHYARGTGHPM